MDDVKKKDEAFDSPARQLGLDMHLDKTELHVMRGCGHTTIQYRHGGVLSTVNREGQPHEVY